MDLCPLAWRRLRRQERPGYRTWLTIQKLFRIMSCSCNNKLPFKPRRLPSRSNPVPVNPPRQVHRFRRHHHRRIPLPIRPPICQPTRPFLLPLHRHCFPLWKTRLWIQPQCHPPWNLLFRQNWEHLNQRLLPQWYPPRPLPHHRRRKGQLPHPQPKSQQSCQQSSQLPYQPRTSQHRPLRQNRHHSRLPKDPHPLPLQMSPHLCQPSLQHPVLRMSQRLHLPKALRPVHPLLLQLCPPPLLPAPQRTAPVLLLLPHHPIPPRLMCHHNRPIFCHTPMLPQTHPRQARRPDPVLHQRPAQVLLPHHRPLLPQRKARNPQVLRQPQPPAPALLQRHPQLPGQPKAPNPQVQPPLRRPVPLPPQQGIPAGHLQGHQPQDLPRAQSLLPQPALLPKCQLTVPPVPLPAALVLHPRKIQQMPRRSVQVLIRQVLQHPSLLQIFYFQQQTLPPRVPQHHQLLLHQKVLNPLAPPVPPQQAPLHHQQRILLPHQQRIQRLHPLQILLAYLLQAPQLLQQVVHLLRPQMTLPQAHQLLPRLALLLVPQPLLQTTQRPAQVPHPRALQLPSPPKISWRHQPQMALLPVLQQCQL
mmetsp:Transcript_5544/g.15660  ORF Transcript_5544/g.15660 Transcript_5544/m.15660 type:complete len:585 (-) Transcript_5544:1145-2899(-)